MEAIEIIVIIAACLTVAGVVIGSIARRRKNKKNGCVGGCCGCPHSNHCGKIKHNDGDKNN